jgi:hypothetical protein
LSLYNDERSKIVRDSEAGFFKLNEQERSLGLGRDSNKSVKPRKDIQALEQMFNH